MTLEQIGIITGILSAVFTGAYFLHKIFKERLIKIRKKISGEWGNEGDLVLSKLETHFIELTLEVDIEDGEITGTVKSTSLIDESYSPLCSVNGKLKYRTGRIEITHVRHGQVIVYGTVTIELKEKLLYWKLKDDVINFFPKETILFRH